MKRWIALAALAASSAGATSPADYAAVFPITTDGNQAAWLVDLDIDAYRWSQDEDLRDIAIFNAAGNPVPLGPWNEITPVQVFEDREPVALLSLPRVVVPKISRGWRTPSVDGNIRREDQAIEVRTTRGSRPNREWLIDAGNLNVGVDTISLDWESPTSGVVARFDVDGSSDLESWINARRGASVLLLEEDGTRIDRRDIRLDLPGLAYLRLVRTDDGPDLIGLHAEISGRYEQVGAPASLQWVDAGYHSMVTDDATHEIQWRYELPAALPISQIRLGLFDDNALANLQVLSGATASDGSMRWYPRGQTTAYRLRRGDDLIENPEIPLSSGSRTRNVRIDSTTPLAQPPRISAGYRPKRIVFLAEGDAPYLLAVGSRVARHPDYPIATAIDRLRVSSNWKPQTARLGALQTSAGASAIAPPEVKKESPGWKRGLLWAVLIIAAAVVGSLALALLRGDRQGGTEDRQQPPEE